MTQPDHIIIKTVFGFEPILANELEALGATNIQILRRAVQVDYDKKLLYKMNMALRTALRVLVPLASFKAENDKELYEQALGIEWTNLFDISKTFSIHADIKTTHFKHSNFVSLKVKDALVDKFRATLGERPNVQSNNAEIEIYVLIGGDKVTIYLDSSGESLHKRGYKKFQNKAPLSEVLAAGLVIMSGWKGETPFVDGMCGAGTILIEAAFLALNKAPNLKRRNFCFSHWKDFDLKLYQAVSRELVANENSDLNVWLYGYDNHGHSINMAAQNIEAAGLDEFIKLKKISFFETQKPADSTTIILNPPYGERMEVEEIETFYRTIGDTFKHKYTNCTGFVLSSNRDAMKRLGLKTTSRVQLMNGELDCAYHRYDMFEGKSKDRMES